jgi:hypothetical protein
LIRATLVYDSAQDVLCGARGFGTQPRMLFFKGKGVTVDLMVWDRGERACSVHGQVTEGPTRTPVAGAQVSAPGADVVTDGFGEFSVVLGREWRHRELIVRTSMADVVCAIPREDELDPPALTTRHRDGRGSAN